MSFYFYFHLVSCSANYYNFFIYFFSLGSTFSADTPCGDWEQYKDEHCYKLFTGLQSYSDAEKLCQTNNSILAVIHYAEEQIFLSSLIFTAKKAVDNVWIGAKYIGEAREFQWADHTAVKGYANWALGYPKNLTGHCVQMTAEEPKGKWTDEPCAKRNMVICQRQQPLSIKLLTEAVIELKHSLQRTSNILEETKNQLIETKESVTQLKRESFPIGFTYVQLPKDKAPSELWPTMTWTDISSEYEGVFFRVVGGGSDSFGMVQHENAPRLEMVFANIEKEIKTKKVFLGDNMTIPLTGWSKALHTGDDGGTSIFTSFKHTDTAEVRPKNMAIKVYKRTA